MATLTRVALLQALSEAWGDWWSQVTTAAGSTTTTVDSKLAQLSADDDFCIGWYVRKVAANGGVAGEIRRITAYVASTTTITHAAFTTAGVGNGLTYELHRIDPLQKHNALARASVLCFPGSSARHGLYLEIRDETLIVDNLLTNSDIESTIVAGAHPSWTNVGAGITVTTESTIVRHRSQAAKIVAGGGAAGQMTQTFGTVNIDTLTGKAAMLEFWVYATAASTARIRLDWDGTNFANYAYHSGTAQWEYQKLSVAVPTTATQVKAILEVAAGGTAYFDAGWGGVSPVQKYTIPTTILRGPFTVLQQADELQPEGNYYPLAAYARPTAGRRLRLIGMGLLSQPSTDAGTVEIDTNQAEYFLAQASQWLYRSLRQGGSQMERDYLGMLRGEWQQDIQKMEHDGTTMNNLAAELPNGTWRTEEDSSGRYIMFTQKR